MKTTVVTVPGVKSDSRIFFHEPLLTSGIEHAFIVDYQSGEGKLLQRLQTAAEQASKEHPPVDLISILHTNRLPDMPSIQSLNLLQPRHLEMHSDYDETNRIDILEHLNWRLESLTISGACSHGEEPSEVVASIPTLTLHFCCAIFFSPSTRKAALRHLNIIDNNANDMFIDIVKKLGLAKTLLTLKIQNGNDFTYGWHTSDFTATLKQCTALVTLELDLQDDSMGEDSYLIHLPLFIPSSVEHLIFRGPPTLSDLSVWTSCANEPSWLPNLKSLSFGFRSEEEDADPLVVRPREFLDAILKNRPGLQIIDDETST